MEGWRLYAGMIALAALTGMVVALALSGGPRLPETRPATSASARVVSFSPTPSVRPTATARASSSPSPILSPSPSPSPTSRGDLPGLLRPLTATWRPTVTSLLLARPAGSAGTTIFAVPVVGPTPSPGPSTSPRTSPSPLTAASPIPLVSFGATGGWQARPDASVLAVSLETAEGTARVATWNLRTGAMQWVTEDEPGVRHSTPVWSADGSLIYYAATRGPVDLGIFRIRGDGTAKTLLRAADARAAGTALVSLTPDGAGIVWGYIRAGGSTDVYDLQTGRDRAFDDDTSATPLAWRPTRPRALVAVGGGGAGLAGGSLVLWDDLAATSRVLIPAQAAAPSGVLAADWDPTGTRIVAAVTDRTNGAETSSLLTFDAAGATRAALPGTDGANTVLWLRAGIVYGRATAARGTEILLISPSGSIPVVLYADDGPPGRLTFVAP